MAWQSGVATDVVDLAAQLKTWLEGLTSAWIYDRDDAQGTGRRQNIHKGAVYVGLRFANNEDIAPFSTGAGHAAYAVGQTGYSGAVDWYDQAGAPLAANGTTRLGAAAPCAASNITYQFFSDATDDNIIVIVQRAAGVFNYLAWGSLDADHKAGTWTGGQYFYGARPGHNAFNTTNQTQALLAPPIPLSLRQGTGDARPLCFVRIDEGGFGEEWRGGSTVNQVVANKTTRYLDGAWTYGLGPGNVADAVQMTGGTMQLGRLYCRTRNELAGNVTPLRCPIFTFVAAQSRWRPIGHLPMIRAAICAGLLPEGEQFSIGADDYRAFNSYVVQQL
jgi:hypothetical protein